METTYNVEVNWGELHQAVSDLDRARHGLPYVRTAPHSDPVTDPFGGTYSPSWYEGQGLVGLVNIRNAAVRLAHQAWHVIHSGSATVATAGQIIESDYEEWWSTGFAGRADMHHRTHRGAAWRATRYGGRLERRVDQNKAKTRVERALGGVRAAVRTAMAVHRVFQLLASAGVMDYTPQSHICGVWTDSDGVERLNVTGIGWLMGETRENRAPSTDAAISV